MLTFSHTRAGPGHPLLTASLLAIALAGPGIAWAGQPPAASPGAYGNPDLRAGAWSHSVTLEKQGHLRQARQLLIDGWGSAPTSYEITVRIAWLSLEMDDLDAAEHYYQRARTLPGAAPEATQGLASTWARRGFIELDHGRKTEARDDFNRAIALQPDHPEAKRGLSIVGPASYLTPEVWLGYQDMSVKGHDWYGLAIFGQLTYQVSDGLLLRGAYRRQNAYADMPTLVGGPQTGGPPHQETNTQTFSQDELYLGVGTRSPWFDFDALAIAVLPAKANQRFLGGASSVRFGRKLGGLLEGSWLKMSGGQSRTQIDPAVYWWPSDRVGFALGAKLTLDSQPTAVSYHAGVTAFVGSSSRVDAEAFVGPQRTPVSMTGTQVTNILPEMTSGVNASWLLGISRDWRLGLQGNLARVTLNNENGTYAGTSVGLQWDVY